MVKRKIFRSYTERALSEAQYQALLDSCGHYEDTCLLYLGVRFGLRRADVISVQKNDVDVVNGRLTFYEHKKSRTRTLPIPSDILPWFTQYLKTIPKNQKTLLGYTDDKTAYNHLQMLCVIAGINVPYPFHALRGTCYKRLRSIYKWNLESASAWLGDTVEVAAKHYGAVSDGELADLVHRDIKLPWKEE